MSQPPHPSFLPPLCTLQVSSVVVAAAEPMTDISLLVGCDSSGVFANKLVAVSTGEHPCRLSGNEPPRRARILAW